MPFFERNSFALRQELHPGWVNSTYFSATVSMLDFRDDGSGRLPRPPKWRQAGFHYSDWIVSGGQAPFAMRESALTRSPDWMMPPPKQTWLS